MLAAGQRLRRRGDFTAAVRRGRRAARGVIVVHLVAPEHDRESAPPVTDPARPGRGDGATLGAPAQAPGPHIVAARVGFVVPRTVGVAVVRNRVKRRLRHLVRDRLADLPPGSDLVVRALPGAADRTYPQLGADLDGALDAVRQRRVRR